MNKRKEELAEAAASMLNEPIITMGLMEHQVDLIAKVVLALAEKYPLDEQDQQTVESLKSVMRFSSINFNNLEHPFESYKIPKVIEGKERTRMVQEKYLQAQLREGLL